MTQQLLSSPAPRARPFRVCNWDRSLRKGIMAESLADLLGKVGAGLGGMGRVRGIYLVSPHLLHGPTDPEHPAAGGHCRSGAG